MSPYAKRQRVLVSPNRRRLVIYTIREEPPGQIVRNRCEVWQWNAVRYKFVPVANEQTTYCDPKTGKPIAGKSYPIGLPDHP